MTKTYITLGVLLLILSLSAYLVLQKEGEVSVSTDSGVKFMIVDSASVNKIDVSSPSLSFTLEKQGSNWMIKQSLSYKAANGPVADLIHQLKELEVKSIVSSNPEKQLLFNVDSMQGIGVALFESGNKKSSFIVGKTGPSFNDTYVRKTGSNDVLLVNASLTYTFTKPAKDWRDKTIVSTPSASITEVNYQYGDTAFALKNSNGVWMIGKDSTQQDIVSSLISFLSDFKGDDFLDSTNTVIQKIQAQVSFTNNQIRFAFDRTANKYYVQSSSSPQWFIVEQWKANQVLKRKKELIKK